MTKSELATHVATQASLSSAAADRAVNAVFSAITDALANEEIVTVTGFGTFTIKKRQARQGRNPRTGESISIAASKVPSFKAGKTLRDAVR
jgi:DNA-binding protein HU-beta